MLESLFSIYNFYHNNPDSIVEYLQENVEDDALACNSGFTTIHELLIYHLEYTTNPLTFYNNVLESIE